MKKGKIKLTLKPNYKVKMENIHQHIEEVKRGAGVIKPKRGRGSYTRKVKHKKDLSLYSWD